MTDQLEPRTVFATDVPTILEIQIMPPAEFRYSILDGLEQIESVFISVLPGLV